MSQAARRDQRLDYDHQEREYAHRGGSGWPPDALGPEGPARDSDLAPEPDLDARDPDLADGAVFDAPFGPGAAPAGGAIYREDRRGRRRQIADWGGDELFGGRPVRGRRFARSGSAGPEGYGAAPPHTSGADDHHSAAHRAAQPHPGGAGDHDPDPAPPRADGLPADGRADARFARPEERTGPGGRRTVRIGARTGPPQPARAPARRRRPPRTVHDRVGARPDRTAMWAFALGLLLILVAIATAGGLG